MLKGTLDDFTLPEIFRLMSLARKTGKLDVKRSAGNGTVFFRDGDVYYAESSVAREPLGQKLIKAGHLGEGQLIKALDEHATSGVRVGEVLVKMAAVTEEQLQRAVQEQIEDAVFDLLRWELGEFSWEGGVIADVEVPIQVSGENLIMEASRKLDELESLLRKIPSENAVLAMSSTPPEGAVEIRFTPEEWRLLVLVDGRRTVHEIAEMSGMDDLNAIKAFYGVVSAGLVEVVRSGVPELDEPQPAEAVAEEAPAGSEPAAVAEPEPVVEPEPAPEISPSEAIAEAIEAEPAPDLSSTEPEPAEDVLSPAPEPVPTDEADLAAETVAAGDQEVPEEVLAEPEPGLLAEIDLVDVPELDILTEEPVGQETPAAETEAEAEDSEGIEAPAASETPTDEPAWEGFAPEAFDAPQPEEMVTETPAEDAFLSDLLGEAPAGPPAPEAPNAGPRPAAPPAPEPPTEPAPEPAPEPPAAAEAAEPEAPEVDRAAVVRELAGLFDDDIQERSRPARPSARKETPKEDAEPEDERKRVEDDDQVTRGLISRLIDGVKGL